MEVYVQSSFLDYSNSLDCERLLKIGLLNKDMRSIGQLVDGEIETVSSRRNPLRVKLDNRVNPILNPEYDSKMFYHTNETEIHERFRLRIDLMNRTVLTVRPTGMGWIHVMRTSDQKHLYIFKRDFNWRSSRP